MHNIKIIGLPKAQGGLSFFPQQDPEMMYRDRFNTSLNKEEEKLFNEWGTKESERQGRDIMMDKGAYDIQGFWKSGDYKKMDQDNHGTDTWKKPNHPTFSNQSKYHGIDGFYGGNWNPDGGYQPSKQTASSYGPSYYSRMFAEEPNRPEHLDASRYTSGTNSPSPLYYKQGGLTKYQTKGQVPCFDKDGYMIPCEKTSLPPHIIVTDPDDPRLTEYSEKNMHERQYRDYWNFSKDAFKNKPVVSPSEYQTIIQDYFNANPDFTPSPYVKSIPTNPKNKLTEVRGTKKQYYNEPFTKPYWNPTWDSKSIGISEPTNSRYSLPPTEMYILAPQKIEVKKSITPPHIIENKGHVDLPNLQQKSNYAFTWSPDGSKQQTNYFPTYDAWKSVVDKANTGKPGYNAGMVETSENANKSFGQALLRGTPQFNEGGLTKYQEGSEYTGTSVVDYLKTKGYSADKSYRKGLAKKYNIADYDYSGPKNMELLNRLREDENLQETIGAPTNTPIPLDKLMEMMSGQRAVSHAQQKMVDPRDVIARINVANMNLAPGVTPSSNMLSNRMQYTPAAPSPSANLGTVNAMMNIASMNFNPTSTPNKGFLKNRMQYTPLPTMPDRPVEQGLNPAVLNMMLSTQRPMNQTEITKIPNNPFGSITGGGGSKIAPPGEALIADMYPEINRIFDTAHQQTPYVDPLHRDVIMSPNTVNMLTQPATPPPVVKPMTQETSASKSGFSRNIDDLEDYMASTISGAGVKINRGIDAVNNFIDEGKQNVSNFYTRHFGTSQEDELKNVSHLSTITTPPAKPASNSSAPVVDTTPPIKIDAPIITDWNKNHPDTYHAATVVDLKRIKLGTRNRGEYPEVESDGYLFGGIDVKGNPRRFVNAKTSKLDPNKFYIGADSEGNVISGLGKDIAGKDIRVMDFRVFKNVKGLATDAKGNLKFHHTDNLKTLGVGPDSWTPYYIDEKGNELGDTGPLSYSQYNQKDLNTYGSVTGGHVIVTSPDFSKQILISGSINDIRTQIENFKKQNNYSTINAIQVDNGSAAQNVFKKNKKLTKKDWDAIDGRNRSIGGSGFYLLGRGYKMGGSIDAGPPEYKRGGPIVSREGYKQGPPPDGSYYQIPGDTLYNPTPYKIKATSDNGITKTLNPFDETSVQFPGAKYVNEQHYAEGGGVKDPLSNYYNHRMAKGGSPRKPVKSMVNNEKKVKLEYKLKYKID